MTEQEQDAALALLREHLDLLLEFTTGALPLTWEELQEYVDNPPE